MFRVAQSSLIILIEKNIFFLLKHFLEKRTGKVLSVNEAPNIGGNLRFPSRCDYLFIFLLCIFRLPILEDHDDVDDPVSGNVSSLVLTRYPRWFTLSHIETEQCALSCTMINAARSKLRHLQSFVTTCFGRAAGPERSYRSTRFIDHTIETSACVVFKELAAITLEILCRLNISFFYFYLVLIWLLFNRSSQIYFFL